jgi:hypothetical protein
MQRYYSQTELQAASKTRHLSGYLIQKLFWGSLAVQFFAGIALLLPMIMLHRVFLDRRVRFLILCVLVVMAGMAVEVFLLAHYLAPFTAAFYAIGLQAMRHLRLWKPGSIPVGLALVRLTVTICFLMAGLRTFAGPLHLSLPQYPPLAWNFVWYGPGHFGTERSRVEDSLKRIPGKQLAIVRYSSQHSPFEEWVYNDADIEGSKIVWAREMDAVNNRELLDYYKDRKVWLVQPDSQSAMVTEYPASEREAVALQ